MACLQVVAHHLFVEIDAVGDVAAVEPFGFRDAALRPLGSVGRGEPAVERHGTGGRRLPQGRACPCPHDAFPGLVGGVEGHVVHSPEEVERLFRAADRVEGDDGVLVGLFAEEERSLLHRVDAAHVPAGVPKLGPGGAVVAAYLHVVMVGEILVAAYFKEFRIDVVPEIEIHGSFSGTHHQPFVLMQGGEVFVVALFGHPYQCGTDAVVGESRAFVVLEAEYFPVPACRGAEGVGVLHAPWGCESVGLEAFGERGLSGVAPVP